MKLELTDQEFRYLLDLVYIGNWVLNSTEVMTASRNMIRWRVRSSPTASPRGCPSWWSGTGAVLSPPAPLPTVASTSHRAV